MRKICMKAVDAQKITGARTCVLSVCMLLLLCYVVPFGSGLAKALGGAALFTAAFWSCPERFLSRRGSLAAAYGLIAFVWLSAAVVVVLSLSGAVEL